MDKINDAPWDVDGEMLCLSVDSVRIGRNLYQCTYYCAYRAGGWTPELIAKERARFMARHWYAAWAKRIPRG